jgi:hypothetical protein
LLSDLIGAIPELRDDFSEAALEEWLGQQTQFSLPDVRSVCANFPSVWQRILSLKLLLATTPPDRADFVDWIFAMDSQDLELTADLTQVCTASLLSPKFEFRRPDEESAVTPRGLYLTVRLYALSFANPGMVGGKAIEKVYALSADRDRYAAAAAAQVLGNWVRKFDFVPELWSAYQIAAQVEGAGTGLSALYRAALALYARVLPIVEVMLLNDRTIRYDRAGTEELAKAPWVFPHLKPILEGVPLFEGYDEKQALDVLGEIAEYFEFAE